MHNIKEAADISIMNEYNKSRKEEDRELLKTCWLNKLTLIAVKLFRKQTIIIMSSKFKELVEYDINLMIP